MKNNVKKYDRLINKLFLKAFTIFGSAIVIVIILRLELKNKIAINISEIISKLANVSPETATSFYQKYIQGNIEFFVVGIVCLILLFAFILFVKSLTKYFDQIVDGMDKLGEESNEEIVMSPELDFIEDKLNKVNAKLRRKTTELKEAEQRKNDLVVYLAHDIKTPLTSVIGYLNLLDDEPNLPTEVKAKYVHISLEKAYRLEKLINEFFEITRYNLQKVSINKENINLCYMLVQVADELYPQAIDKKKEIVNEVDENIEIQGDAEKLARVFNNVLKNAINYGTENSTISITAEKSEENVYIYIKNSGAIKREMLDKIFEKFYRADESRNSATGGAGLGLAISKDIITLHGGTIKAESDGTNTIFIISLPIELIKS